MKRLILCLFVVAACVALCACGGEGIGSTTAGQPEPTTTVGQPDQPTRNQPHEHMFGDWTVTTAATCTADGLNERTCACGEKETEVILSTGHGATEVRDAKAATCTAEGYTGDTYCTVCNEKLETGAAIPATGHDYQGGICSACGEKAPSEGLKFAQNYGGQSYRVIGIGTCTDTDIVIPSSYKDRPVTEIRSEAFSGCNNLTSIVIPDSVTCIGYEAFRDCSSLTSIEIPDSLTWICNDAFLNTAYYNNENNWENGILYIDNHLIAARIGVVFSDIKPGTKSIADSAFYSCTNLMAVLIPDSVTSIGDWAFMSCKSLTSIVIPDSVTSIGWTAFSNCSSLTSIVIPDSVTSIGKYAFDYCDSLTSVTIGSGVTSIDDYTFSDCNGLTGFVIPDGVTSIGRGAFHDCSSLTSIVIPDSVTSIGEDAFEDCGNLTSITFSGTKAQWKVISKGNYWDYNTGAYTIHCTDGDIQK